MNRILCRDLQHPAGEIFVRSYAYAKKNGTNAYKLRSKFRGSGFLFWPTVFDPGNKINCVVYVVLCMYIPIKQNSCVGINDNYDSLKDMLAMDVHCLVSGSGLRSHILFLIQTAFRNEIAVYLLCHKSYLTTEYFYFCRSPLWATLI